MAAVRGRSSEERRDGAWRGMEGAGHIRSERNRARWLTVSAGAVLSLAIVAVAGADDAFDVEEFRSTGRTVAAEIADLNGDGYLDIFNAEMRFGEGNPDSEIRILLGDGEGNFKKETVATGFGVHEGKLTDLDGDGDLDVLGKPYSWQAPRLDIWLNETEK